MNQQKVRVRFAPSPTGPLHMGGVRTALFNYLFAKKNKSDFLLRNEDTDQNRFVPGAESYIINALKWCGIEIDEGPEQGGAFGPYRQSERKELYHKYAIELINKGFAYYAFDTPEELENIRKKFEDEKQTFSYGPATRSNLNNSLRLKADETQKLIDEGTDYVIRFKMPENEDIYMNDLIRGSIKVNSLSLDDKVLFKSDGMPTYHLANIVDDHLMKISHVIRGEEWLPSLPLHVLLYKAFDWLAPEFAHLPLLLKPTGNGKLSKRDGDKLGFPVFPLLWEAPNGDTAKGYREEGYFAEAFVNLLALLGWNPGTEQEIFTMEELIQQFSLERVTKAGARFDPEKAKWFNHQYLLRKSSLELAPFFMKELEDKSIFIGEEKAVKILELIKDRVNFVHEIYSQSFFFFEAPSEYDEKVVKKRWKEGTGSLMLEIKDILKECANFTSENIESLVKDFIQQNELNMGQVMNSFRLCLVGSSMGPGLMDIAELIGKDETLNRIERAVLAINK